MAQLITFMSLRMLLAGRCMLQWHLLLPSMWTWPFYALPASYKSSIGPGGWFEPGKFWTVIVACKQVTECFSRGDLPWFDSRLQLLIQQPLIADFIWKSRDALKLTRVHVSAESSRGITCLRRKPRRAPWAELAEVRSNMKQRSQFSRPG